MEQRPILLVEDDDALRDTLAYNLRQDGYETLTAADGVTALELARAHPLALVILDVMLPRLDGLEVLRQLRARPETARVPVMMLTARVEESDIVVGLELGADDYVTKPFSWNEARARVRALLRRGAQQAGAQQAGSAPAATEAEPLVAGDLVIDEARREVRKDGQVIALPTRLFELLAYLARHRGIVLTRGRLLEQVWGYDYVGDTRTVDVHVRWLREKIEDDPASPRLIQTVRGVGYRFKG
ncbi:MAG TPA: response regulator transcription factor [Ktedonobacterales bacterium]|nr:response regulator transcription factor [Ktedonobacterales bacterium]